MNKTAQFHYTFPVLKAEQREDGRYITGEASGPEIDATHERMSPDCIARFTAQIAEQAASGNPLVYRDAHAPDGVLRDLGEITNATVDERMHMAIEVKLEDNNPAADYLWHSITVKKRKWGMSIAGMVRDYVDEFVEEAGRVIRTYKDVILTEISNTTRPAWTPSFGTVLSKAIEDAEIEDEFSSEVEKAKWTTAYINNLPDSSFAYIAPGGKKDSDGKTTPRSLRSLPYKDADGKVDAAHVRNALARLDQTDIPAAAKASAKKKLLAAAKQVGIQTNKTVDEANASDETEGENVGAENTLQADEQVVAPSDATDDTNKADESLGDDEPVVTPEADGTDDAEVEGAADEGDEGDVDKSKLSNEAASVGYSISSLIDVLGNETDEARIADLRAAIAHLQSVQTSAVAAVGSPEDKQSQWSTDAADADVEKTGRTLSAANAKRLVELRDNLNSFLTDLGVEGAPTKSDSSDAEPDLIKTWDVEKTELTAKVEELERTVAEKTARVEELEAMPASAVPPLVRSTDEGQELADMLAKMTPAEKLRFGLQLKHD